MPYREPTRCALERMLFLHERLSRSEAVNCTQAGRALEVSPQTILRDLDYMRYRLGLPVAFVAERHTYVYLEPVAAFPTVKVSEGDVFSLFVVSKALEQYRGTPFHRQLATSFAKLTAGLKEEVSFSMTDEMRSVSFKSVGLGKADFASFEVLKSGLFRRREVEFDYAKAGERTTTRRRVRPYHLSERDHLWYLVGFDLDRQALRTFAMPRVANAVLTERGFTRPADFDAEKYFASALSALPGNERHTVRVRFRGAAADHVREREWHHTQQLRDLPDGEVELTLTLGALAEVARWVLTWGPSAEVIAPKALRDQVQATIEEMRQRYRGRRPQKNAGSDNAARRNA